MVLHALSIPSFVDTYFHSLWDQPVLIWMLGSTYVEFDDDPITGSGSSPMLTKQTRIHARGVIILFKDPSVGVH